MSFPERLGACRDTSAGTEHGAACRSLSLQRRGSLHRELAWRSSVRNVLVGPQRVVGLGGRCSREGAAGTEVCGGDAAWRARSASSAWPTEAGVWPGQWVGGGCGRNGEGAEGASSQGTPAKDRSQPPEAASGGLEDRRGRCSGDGRRGGRGRSLCPGGRSVFAAPTGGRGRGLPRLLSAAAPWPQAQRHWRVCALSVSGPAARGAVGAAAASGAPDSSVGCRPPCRWAERCPRAPAGAACAVSSAVDGAASPGSAATPARAPEAGVRAPPHTRAPGLLVTVGRGCLRDRRAHVRRRRARSDADAVTAGGSRDGPGDQRGVGHQRSGVPCPPRGVAPSRSPGARNAYRSRPAQAHPGPWGGACVAGRGQAHAFVLQRRHRAPRGQVGVQRAPGGSPEGEHTGAPSKAQGSLGLL